MAQPATADHPLIVVSYHASDEYWADSLVAQLSQAKSKYGLWVDRIDDQRERVDPMTLVALATAAVLVILVSPRYLKSSWLARKEGQRSSDATSPYIVGLLVHDLTREQHLALPSNCRLINSTPLWNAPVETLNVILAQAVTQVTLLLEDNEADPPAARPEDNYRRLTIDNLSPFARSTEVENALRRARRLATLSPITPSIVTTPALLFALAEGGRDARPEYFRTPQFLWKEFTARGEDLYTKALLDEFPGLTRLGERAGRNIDSLSAETNLVTPNTLRVFKLAEDICHATVGTAPASQAQDASADSSQQAIGARHLLAALLVLGSDHGPTGASQRIATMVDVVALRRRFYNFIVKNHPHDDHAAWGPILINLKLPQPQPKPTRETNRPSGGAPAQPSVAGFMADEWKGRDLLGIERDVNALASLVAAYKVEPPLSIGLFGDWGSGKSHFMRQMRKRVDLLSQLARDSAKPQNELGYYKNIVQIEFNAWHYIEGNLWASLVDHIFANLRLSEREDPTYAEQRRDELMQKLGVQEDIQKKINCRVKEREHELTQLEERKHQAEAARDQAATQLEGFKEEARASLDKLSISIAFTDEEKELLARLGIDAGNDISAADVRKNYLKIKSGWNSLRARWRLFRTDPKTTRRYVLSALLAAIPIAGALLVKFKGLPGLPTTAATVLGFVATAYVAAKPAWDQFRKSLQALEKHDEEVERQRKQRITQLSSEISALTKEIVDAKLEGETIGKEVEKLKADISSTTSTRLLAEFIEDRAAATDYRRHLGLLALIRRDFEKLRDLFEQQRNEAIEGKAETDEKKIDRIVLYIDDLDRCPPDRVVQVLQAIHLLLAFPLFVVVVGVDSRWITRSLEQSYEWLRQVDEETNGERKNGAEEREDRSPRTGATPHDYLEKIFQIPFWLRSMNDDACVAFLDGLTKDAVGAQGTKKTNGSGSDIQQTPTAMRRPNPDVQSTPVPDLVHSVPARRSVDVNIRVEPPPTVVPIERAAGENDHTNGGDKEEIDVTPLGLTFSEKEIEYMKKLVPLIGRSPRAVKRFLNCYRLIKVGLTPAEFGSFVGDNGESHGYKAAMILLGVITGTPTVSSYVIEELMARRGSNEFTQPLADALEANAELLQQPDSERLIKFFQTHDFGPADNPLLKEIMNYAPRVSRFSFRVNRTDLAGRKPASPR